METGKNIWGIHGQERNTFLSKKAPHIGLGWNKLGDVTHLRSRKEFEDRYIQVYGRDKSLSQTVGQNYRFVVEVSIGDYVVYSKDRVIHIGVVTSEAQHHPNKVYSTIREVKWLSHAPASMLPVSAYNEVNSALSFFSLKNNPLAFLNILKNNPVLQSELYLKLKREPDIITIDYDGSYELIQFLTKQYDGMLLDNIDYKDLDSLYLSIIGTWKVGFNKKKQKIMESNLTIDKKKKVIEFITSIEDKTKKGLYEYSEFGESRRTMGLFGTGFMTFKDSKPDDVRKLVELLINVNKDDDQDRILKYVEAVFQQPMHGIKTGVASVLLHCLKPHIFPVFNRNMGIGQSVFSELGIGLSDPLDLETYIENVKLVIDFRDEHFSFKNFRVLDFASRLLFKNVLKVVKLKKIDSIITAPTEIEAKDWIELLNDKSITSSEVIDTLKLWYQQENYEASCKELSDKHGKNFGFYNATIMNYGKKITKEKKIDVRDQNDEKTYWSVIMNGRDSVYNDTKVFNWILKEELVDALEELNFVSSDLVIEEEKNTYNEYTKIDFLEEAFMTEEDYDKLHRVLLRKSNIILQGSPGVGKTFLAKRFAYSILGEKDDSAIEMVQFHQSYSYEDFVFGYHPTETSFELKPGIFYTFCKKAEKNPNKLHFFIIDEINRGNLSKIFGELLMLIEADKRGTSITLSHTKETFSVPKNIYIIGMMNTADRSLAIIDYALRRRFSFVKIEPAFNKNKFETYMLKNKVPSALINKIISRFNQLNSDIENDPSLGAGFSIGHSYFCDCTQANDTWYQEIIEHDIKPILEEYWFDSPEKVEQFIYELLK